jgi:O-antigen/teichoic acid export membrane protein
MQTAFPGLAELKSSAPRSKIRHAALALSQAILSLSGAVSCVVLAVNHSFIDWWVGANQYGGGMLSALIVVAILVRHWNLTFTYSLFCFGYERRLALTGLGDGITTVFATALLIPHVGAIGAPLGMIIGTCLVNIPANLVALGREMQTSPLSLLSASTGWAVRFVVVAAVAMITSRMWSPHGFLQIALEGAFIGALYSGLLLPVLLRGPLGSYVRPRLGFLPQRFYRMLPATAE